MKQIRLKEHSKQISSYKRTVNSPRSVTVCLCVMCTGELDKLQAECSTLHRECESLRSEKVTLLEKLHRLEVELSRSVCVITLSKKNFLHREISDVCLCESC